MKTHSYSLNREVPELYHVDVLVVGGGCAGIAAAVSAARRGCSVLLMERNMSLGGTATSGLVGPFMTSSDPEGHRQLIQGFFRELVDRLVKTGGAVEPMSIPNCTGASSWHEFGHRNITPFSQEALKLTAEQMCQESGVELLYGVTAMDVRLSPDGHSLEGVYALAREGIVFIGAKMFVDCSGDADLAFLAGCPVCKGESETGELQAGGLFFQVDGIDEDILNQRKEKLGWESMRFEKEIAAAVEKGDYSIPRRRLGMYKGCDNMWKINATRIPDVDGTRSQDLTRLAVEGRRQVEVICRFLRKYVHGCENLRLIMSAEMPGVRETRRIQGDFVLREESIVNGEVFPDRILVCSNSRDTHAGLVGRYIPSKKCYTLPYRMLVPRKIQNLLAAGRIVSCDRAVLAAIRVMPPCFGMGEAAGNAAALALEQKCPCGKIDIEKLQKRLREEGAVLE